MSWDESGVEMVRSAEVDVIKLANLTRKLD
jgi:hypothetical protein